MNGLTNNVSNQVTPGKIKMITSESEVPICSVKALYLGYIDTQLNSQVLKLYQTLPPVTR